MTGVRCAALSIVVALACAHAHAQSSDSLSRARTHFEAGRALYNLGNYTDAIREFSAGYELVPKPEFLLNLGLCYRKLDDLDKAREMYKKFLAEAPANDPERGKAQQRLAEIERAIKERPAVPPPPIATPPPQGEPPQHPVLQTAAPPTVNSSGADLTLHRAPEKRRPAWVVPVAVTASVVVAGAIAVGLYFGLRPADCPASLGCITVGQK